MKLSELKVGMTVTHPSLGSRHEILKVGDGWVASLWSFSDDNPQIQIVRKLDGWQIVEPRKKPSEIVSQFMAGRIYEIASRPAGIGFRDLPQYANDRIDAILKYLDEQASERS